jgi:predicted nucleotidyltransferase
LDLRGVVFPPLEFVFGLNGFDQVSNQDEKADQDLRNDVCFYSLKRFVLLAYKNGAHALEMLHCNPKNIKYISPYMEMLLEHKDKFLSNQLQFSFGGYALTQLGTMRTKKANNTGRKELIEKYGYDTKLFSHSIRLFRMASEVLLTGKLNVLRPDAEELLAIRNGKYTYEEAVQFDETAKKPILTGGLAFEEQKKFEAACAKSILPNHPDFKFINELLVYIQQDYYYQ